MAKASIVEVIKAVLSGFFGIRRGADLENDAARIKPVQVILIGIVCAGLLVLGLVILVKSITS